VFDQDLLVADERVVRVTDGPDVVGRGRRHGLEDVVRLAEGRVGAIGGVRLAPTARMSSGATT
jgi:hypothetical protein